MNKIAPNPVTSLAVIVLCCPDLGHFIVLRGGKSLVAQADRSLAGTWRENGKMLRNPIGPIGCFFCVWVVYRVESEGATATFSCGPVGVCHCGVVENDRLQPLWLVCFSGRRICRVCKAGLG